MTMPEGNKCSPLFALVDCNNFYASCERVFNPKLKNAPIVVLSNNDGCVIARSNEAKALGITMGEPFFRCRSIVKKHGVQVFSSNFALYGDMSRRVMTVLEQFSPMIENYSIDEAFLRLDGVTKVSQENSSIKFLCWDSPIKKRASCYSTSSPKIWRRRIYSHPATRPL